MGKCVVNGSVFIRSKGEGPGALSGFCKMGGAERRATCFRETQEIRYRLYSRFQIGIFPHTVNTISNCSYSSELQLYNTTTATIITTTTHRSKPLPTLSHTAGLPRRNLGSLSN